MHKILIIGNPNVGKSTLFNSLTKSSEHTGNFHGVTVEEKHKIVKFQNEEYDFYDLPGMYSLNSFSFEEEVARKFALDMKADRIVLIDANSIRKNLYLCLQFLEMNIDFKILINNYDYFKKYKNNLDIEKLSNKLNVCCEIINAKKIKIKDFALKNSEKSYHFVNFQKNSLIFDSYLSKYIKIIKNKYNLDEKTIIYALNGIFDNLSEEQINYIQSFYPELILDRYNYIDNILKDSVSIQKNFVYGLNRADRIILKPIVATLGFLFCFFASVYLIFFLIGPKISEGLNLIIYFIFINPFMNFLYSVTSNVWLIEFFSNGVFSSILTVISFLPQILLLFIFLTILEDSGLVSRMAYVFDDFLSIFGLNGKAIYIMLLGLGCNTVSSLATRNMNEKNLRIKTILLNPYISCIARLPIYVIIASAFFGERAYFVVTGLYLLGLFVALIVGFVLNKTILKSNSNTLLLEFPPLRAIDFKHMLVVGRDNAIDTAKRIFFIVLGVGVIVWVLSHTAFDLSYTAIITDSILFYFADKISFLFAPIGLDSAGIVSGLIVGIMAKELLVSTFSISNNVTTISGLISSICVATNVIHFNTASAVSFLVFTLLYCPCVSNLAVIKKEIGRFWMWFAVISQFSIAYLLSFVIYNTFIHNIFYSLIVLFAIVLILISIIYIIKKIRTKKIVCMFCSKNCNKKNNQ